ncbi:MAG: hypothetical protein RLN60_01640 [Phycisphaerales bacterium]
MKTSWPVKEYFIALLIAVLTLPTFAASLDGQVMGDARLMAQFSILAVLALRYVIAAKRRERNKIWIAYVFAMVFSVPIWIFVCEPFAVWVYDSFIR